MQEILEQMQSKTSVIFTAIPNKQNGSVTLKCNQISWSSFSSEKFLQHVDVAAPIVPSSQVVQLNQASSLFPVVLVCIDTLVACAEIDKDRFFLATS